MRLDIMKASILFVILAVTSGCSSLKRNVLAFDRQYLTEPGMEFIVNPMDEIAQQHMFNAREGAIGGFGGAGGGCGCN